MGNADTKLSFRKCVVELTTKTKPVDASDESFWQQFWTTPVSTVQDMFVLIPPAEVRALREESPSNLATLCCKAVQRLVHAADGNCVTQSDQQACLNAVRLLTRILPYLYEDSDWRGFFWSTTGGPSPASASASPNPAGEGDQVLAKSLLQAISDLMFCPDFTVSTPKKTAGAPEVADDIKALDSCEYIWVSGVGCVQSQQSTKQQEQIRTELLRLLLTCCSEPVYLTAGDPRAQENPWIRYFTSKQNRHVLPLFASMLNTVINYEPVGYLPYNHWLVADHKETLVEMALQALITCIDYSLPPDAPDAPAQNQQAEIENLFVHYLSRIHRDEDFDLIIRGLVRLLNNPLMQTYLPGSAKRIRFHQELLVLFWKLCDVNKKFLYHSLKTSQVLDIFVPVLYFLNDARADQTRVGLVHVCVFILLMLSGERNFGVRLNKPYTQKLAMDIPIFSGTHGDLLVVSLHKVISAGHSRLQPLYECMLTVLVNVSPYLKTLSMVSANKLVHLFESFSSPSFLYSSPTSHRLVFYLMEVFNNLVQYQFDGNANLVYTMIRKRQVFHNLANLASSQEAISRVLAGRRGTAPITNLSQPAISAVAVTEKPPSHSTASSSTGASSTGDKNAAPGSEQSTAPSNPPLLPGQNTEHTVEGAITPTDAPPGSLKATLANTPHLVSMTEKQTLDGAPGGMLPENVPHQDGTSVPQSPSAISVNQASTGLNASVSWQATPEWVQSWKKKLPLQTVMRLLQVLVPQVEKMCIEKFVSSHIMLVIIFLTEL